MRSIHGLWSVSEDERYSGDVVRWRQNVSRAVQGAVWSGGVELSETHSKRRRTALTLERPEAPVEPGNGTRFQVEIE
jgi:hypothetical protein